MVWHFVLPLRPSTRHGYLFLLEFSRCQAMLQYLILFTCKTYVSVFDFFFSSPNGQQRFHLETKEEKKEETALFIATHEVPIGAQASMIIWRQEVMLFCTLSTTAIRGNCQKAVKKLRPHVALEHSHTRTHTHRRLPTVCLAACSSKLGNRIEQKNSPLLIVPLLLDEIRLPAGSISLIHCHKKEENSYNSVRWRTSLYALRQDATAPDESDTKTCPLTVKLRERSCTYTLSSTDDNLTAHALTGKCKTTRQLILTRMP